MDKRIDISINNENRQQQKVQTVSKSGRQPYTLNIEVQEQK